MEWAVINGCGEKTPTYTLDKTLQLSEKIYYVYYICLAC